MKKILSLIISFLMVFSCTSLIACKENGNSGGIKEKEGIEVEFAKLFNTSEENPEKFYYSTGINKEGKYDNSLFYRNDMMFPDSADPGVVYDDGYYYVFPTGAPIKCYRTRNFANWEFVSYCFINADDSWAYGNYWAPEVIKSKSDGKYYMYYNASSVVAPSGTNPSNYYTDRMKLGVAVSDKIEGPYAECRDSNNNCICFDMAAARGTNVWAAIDANPFYDGDQLYLYFAKSADTHYSGNDIWGMKMKSMTEPDYSTLTQLTSHGRKTVNGSAISYESGNSVNEGPNVIKHTSANGKTKYYLGYSMYGYTDRRYSVGVAVSDNPLGPYTKLDAKYNQPLMGIESTFDHVSGTGHHQFVEAEGDLYIFYHGHKNVENPSGQRGACVDRIIWEYSSDLGYEIMHANGPTKSLQPSPTLATGYRNIAKDATVSVTNVTRGDKALLTDSMVSVRNYDEGRDVYVSQNGTTVTFEFPVEREVRAILVYNSYIAQYAFYEVSNIRLESSTSVETIPSLIFPSDYYGADKSYMRPGGAVVAEWKDRAVKKISFEIKNKIYTGSGYSGIAFSEVCILGK